MRLRNIFIFAATAIAFNAQVIAQQKKNQPQDSLVVNGFSRTIIEAGSPATNFNYPEMILNATKGKWSAQFSPDIFDKTPKKLGGQHGFRIFIATASYKTKNLKFTAGQLAPFALRQSGAEFIKGLPSTALGDFLNVQPNILGSIVDWNITRDKQNSTQTNIYLLAGTKTQIFGDYGPSNNPGYGAGVWGGGFKVSSKSNNTFKLDTHMNFIKYEGETENNVLYFAANAKQQLGGAFSKVSIHIIGEVQESITANDNNDAKNNSTHSVIMVQPAIQLNQEFNARLGLGKSNLGDVIEAALIYSPQNKKWRAQGGAGLQDGKPVFQFALIRDL